MLSLLPRSPSRSPRLVGSPASTTPGRPLGLIPLPQRPTSAASQVPLPGRSKARCWPPQAAPGTASCPGPCARGISPGPRAAEPLVSRPRCSARGARTTAAVPQPSVQGPAAVPPSTSVLGLLCLFWCWTDLTWGLSPLTSSFLPALGCPVISGAGKGAPEEGLVAPFSLSSRG